MIYFDNASTSFPKSEASVKAVTEYLQTCGVSHSRGSGKLKEMACQYFDSSRTNVANILGCNKDKIFFTHNATHALNTVIRGTLSVGDHVVVSNWNHNSVLRPVNHLFLNSGVSFDIFESRLDGTFDPSDLISKFRENTKAIVVNHASNVTGACFDIHMAKSIAKQHGIKVILDASQTIGLVKDDYSTFDFVIGTGHKSLGGPTGVGFFYAIDPQSISSLIYGGTGKSSFGMIHPFALDERFEAGTPNLLSIVGLGASIQAKSFENEAAMANEIRRHALNQMRELDFLDVQDYSKNSAPIISFNFLDGHPSEIGTLLESRDICLRTGLHCAPLIHKSMGNINGSIRVSFSAHNTKGEVDTLIFCLKDIAFGKKYSRIRSY